MLPVRGSWAEYDNHMERKKKEMEDKGQKVLKTGLFEKKNFNFLDQCSVPGMNWCETDSYGNASEGEQILPPQNMSSWLKDYFELKAIKTLQIQEKHFTSP